MEQNLKRASKTHSCEKCGCNIEKGQIHKAERVYSPVKYNDEFDTKSGGFTETRREHENSSDCQLAINIVQTEFANLNIKP